MESRLQAEATVVSDVRRPRVKLNAMPPGNVLAHVTAAELAKPPASGVFCAHLPPTRRPALGRREGSARSFSLPVQFCGTHWADLGRSGQVALPFLPRLPQFHHGNRNSAVSSSD